MSLLLPNRHFYDKKAPTMNFYRAHRVILCLYWRQRRGVSAHWVPHASWVCLIQPRVHHEGVLARRESCCSPWQT